MIKITMDFETRSGADLKKIGAYEYSMDPSTIATCLGFKASEGHTMPFLFEFNQMQRPFNTFNENFQKRWCKWIREDKYLFSAHNAFFEQCIYQNVLVRRFGWPAIPLRKWRCTAAKAAAVAIPRSLDYAGQVMKLTTQKDYEGHRVMLKLCKPRSAWKKWNDKRLKLELKGFTIQEPEPKKFYDPEDAPEDYAILYKYCKIDVIAEELLDEALPDLIPSEQELWFLDQKINWRGVAVDMPLVKKISGIMQAEAKVMAKELDILTMGLVSSGNARNQILDFLTLEEIELPDLKAKTVDDFLASGKATGDAEKLLKIRRALAKASTAKYQKFLGCAASDGRARDLYLFHGASTGRWGGKNIQPQNFPRGVIKNIYEAIDHINSCSVDELKLLYGENLMPLFSSVLRGMFISTKGKELFVEDLNAIECRVTWWLAGHKKGLKMFSDGIDPYWEMAKYIYKLPKNLVYDETKGQHADWRQVGKAAVLGCGYQMGGKKFKTSAWDVYRAHVDDDTAKVAVKAYRELHHPVTDLWENYNNCAIAAVRNPGRKYRVGPVRFFVDKSFLWIELPSGRPLAYKDPSVTMKTVVLDPDGNAVRSEDIPFPYDEKRLPDGWRSFETESLVYWAVNMKAKKEDCIIPKWTREHSYGGKIVENVVQAVSRDILAHGMINAEKSGFEVLMHSHDELISEAPEKKNGKVLDSKGNWYSMRYREILETPPPWARGLPLKAGGWSGVRYKKG